MTDRDRDSAGQQGTWIGVKPRSAPRELPPARCHYALSWTVERAVAVCGEVVVNPVVIHGTPPDGARHARCDEYVRATAARSPR